MIQYVVTVRFNRRCRGVLDAPPEAGHDSG
jgi:hypothetical protein